MPITDVIIKPVERMALHQTMKGLKIQNIEKVIYNPTNWITGVEYIENDDNQNDPAMP